MIILLIFSFQGTIIYRTPTCLRCAGMGQKCTGTTHKSCDQCFKAKRKCVDPDNGAAPGPVGKAKAKKGKAKEKEKERVIADGLVIGKRRRVEVPVAGPSTLAAQSRVGEPADDLASVFRELGEAEALIAKGHELASRSFGRLADVLAKRGL
jgi:hypothetical protein